MDKALIILASSTSAVAVQKMLEKRFKIYTKIIQAPAELSSFGCSYCIEIDMLNLKTALNLISMSTISIRGVYNAATYEKINFRVSR